jgi:hypothetical protein
MTGVTIPTDPGSSLAYCELSLTTSGSLRYHEFRHQELPEGTPTDPEMARWLRPKAWMWRESQT